MQVTTKDAREVGAEHGNNMYIIALKYSITVVKHAIKYNQDLDCVLKELEDWKAKHEVQNT